MVSFLFWSEMSLCRKKDLTAPPPHPSYLLIACIVLSQQKSRMIGVLFFPSPSTFANPIITFLSTTKTYDLYLYNWEYWKRSSSLSPSYRNSGNVKIWKPTITDLRSWIQNKCWAMKCQGWRMTILGIGQNQEKNATVSKNKKIQWWSFCSKKSSIQFWCFWNSCQFLIQNWIWFFALFLHKFCDQICLRRSLNSSNAQIWKKSWFPILCVTFFLPFFGIRYLVVDISFFFSEGETWTFFGKSAHI